MKGTLCLITSIALLLVDSACAKSNHLILKPGDSRANGLSFQFETRDTTEGRVARIVVSSHQKEFFSQIFVSICEVTQSESGYSKLGLRSLDAKSFENRIETEFRLTPELMSNPKACFVFTQSGLSVEECKLLGHPWADDYVMPLQEFVAADSPIHPRLGKDWKQIDKGARGNKTWANFAGQKADETLSFQIWKAGSHVKLESSPVIQSSIETFQSNGLASISSEKTHFPIADTIRHQIVEIHFGDQVVDAVEFTYLYGDGFEKVASMGHGYIVIFDGVVYALQHTSKSPITSELAFEMICGILSKKHNGDSSSRGDIRPVTLQ